MSKFIVFEGPDGSGKSTQLELLAQYLREELGKKVVTTREPGGTPISQQIREILLNPDNEAMKDKTEILLYAASRAQHIEQLIMPSLLNNKYVLCDRFVDSSIAYQGYGRQRDIDVIKKVNQMATSGVEPDFSVYIMVPPEIAIERIAQKRSLDRLEKTEISFHQRVYQGYLALLKEGQRKYYIDGSNDIETVHDDVKKLVKKRL